MVVTDCVVVINRYSEKYTHLNGPHPLVATSLKAQEVPKLPSGIFKI